MNVSMSCSVLCHCGPWPRVFQQQHVVVVHGECRGPLGAGPGRHAWDGGEWPECRGRGQQHRRGDRGGKRVWHVYMCMYNVLRWKCLLHHGIFFSYEEVFKILPSLFSYSLAFSGPNDNIFAGIKRAYTCTFTFEQPMRSWKEKLLLFVWMLSCDFHSTDFVSREHGSSWKFSINLKFQDGGPS